MGIPDSIPLNDAVSRTDLTDARARFREIVHAVNTDHGARLLDTRQTMDILRDLGGEGAPTAKPIDLGPLPKTVRVVAVPGYLTECVSFLADILTDAMNHLSDLGCATTRARLDGRGGAAHNAKRLRDQIMALPRGERLILIAMSKGAVDTLEMLHAYRETHARIDAVVSLVGAVCGSPLTHMVHGWLEWFERAVPLPTCRAFNGEAVEDLTPEKRLNFLEQYRTPETVRTYSVTASVSVDGMSRGMLSSYQALAAIDAQASGKDTPNDGQMLLADQVIPGSTYLGCLNGDHIAVAMPFNRNPKRFARWVSKEFLDQNAFPREVMAEAIVRHVLEDL